jgi:RNA polymerase sigma factor (TIGR02999 family)
VSESADLTGLLLAWRGGDDDAFGRLVPHVHQELHRLARHYMRGERRGHSLQATALINEACLRLLDARRVDWQSRAHFIGMAATVMRRVLVDHARARGTRKRGGDVVRVTFDEHLEVAVDPGRDLLALDAALQALAVVDPRKSRVVELRCFGGLSVGESAVVLSVSEETVMRDWRLAKAWLKREIVAGPDAPGATGEKGA